MPKPTRATLQKHWGQSSVLDSITRCGAQNLVQTTENHNATLTVVVEDLREADLQTATKFHDGQDRLNHWLDKATFGAVQKRAPRPQRGLQSIEGRVL